MSNIEDFVQGFLDHKINLKRDFFKNFSFNIDDYYNYGYYSGIFLIKYLNYDFNNVINFNKRLSLIQIEYDTYQQIISNEKFIMFIKQFDFDQIISLIDQDIKNIIKNDVHRETFPLEKINQINLEAQAFSVIKETKIKTLLDKDYADLLLFLKLIYYSRLDLVFSTNKKA